MKATITGNIGRMEMRYTQTGKAVLNFSVAENDRNSDNTTWHKVVAWEELAEAGNQALEVGTFVQVTAYRYNADAYTPRGETKPKASVTFTAADISTWSGGKWEEGGHWTSIKQEDDRSPEAPPPGFVEDDEIPF